MKRIIIALSLICTMHISANTVDTQPVDLRLSAVTSAVATEAPDVKFHVPNFCLEQFCTQNQCGAFTLIDLIESRLDFLIEQPCCPCAPKIIKQTDFIASVLIITTPGVYCLATDVTGSIDVASNNVILDLNGHTILSGGSTAVRVSGRSNVVIKNGLIKKITSLIGTQGIFLLNNAHDIRIENVTVTGFSFGLLLDLVSNIAITKTIGTNCFQGLSIQDGCQNIDVQSSSFNENNVGVLASDSGAIRFQECIANNNTTQGFLITTGDCIQCLDCSADNNTVGFYILTSSDIIINDCFACFNTESGFFSTASTLNITNSFASSNFKGFDVEADSSGIIRSCTATNNSAVPRSKEIAELTRATLAGYGFFDDGTNTMEYYSNYACDNDINYDPHITSAPINAPELADGVDNIDCALTVLDACDCACPSDDCSSSDNLPPCAARPIYRTDFTATCPLLNGGRVDAPMKGCTHFTGCLLITESGTYCLAEDVSGSITIQASGVTLDLNGYTLYGLPNLNGIVISNPSLTEPLIDVRVHNGFLAGGVALNRVTAGGGSPVVGIAIDGSTGVVECIRLENLTISNWDNGIAATGDSNLVQFINQLTIKNIMTRSNTNDGIELFFCNDVMIQESSSIQNGNRGIYINDCQNVITEKSAFDFNSFHGLEVNLGDPNTGHDINFRECHANNNGGDGYLVLGNGVDFPDSIFTRCSADSNAMIGFEINACKCVQLHGCSATGNGSGFVIDTQFSSISNASRDILLKDCVACANNNNAALGALHNGFQIDSSFAVCLENCVSKGHTASSVPDNGNGFLISRSFSFSGINIVRGCTASDNTVGFNDCDRSHQSKYYSNISCGNAVNYLNVSDAPITSGAAAQAFENVDCNSTVEGIANLTESIVQIISDIVIDIDADTDATLSFVQDISSRVDLLVCECHDQIVRANSIVDDISSITDTTHSLAEHISSTTDLIAEIQTEAGSRLMIIETEVETLSSLVETITIEPDLCAPIMITTPTTITTPGNYCLANDLTVGGPAIEIAANNVTLDLAGHTITITTGSVDAITVDAGFENIVIKNGLVDCQNHSGTNGIVLNPFVSTPNNAITIENMTIINCGTGLRARGTNNLFIDHVVGTNNFVLGLFLSGVANATVKNTQFEGSSSSAPVDVSGSSNIRLENCNTSNNASGAGTIFFNCSCVEIFDCTAQGNASDGFLCLSCTDVTFKNCYACNNSTFGGGFAGFDILSGNTNVYLLNCVAENNGNGSGFNIQTTSGTLVQGCTATNNGTGFQDSAAGNNRFYSNIACNNSVADYAPAGAFIAAHTTNPNTAGAFQNIACS